MRGGLEKVSDDEGSLPASLLTLFQSHQRRPNWLLLRYSKWIQTNRSPQVTVSRIEENSLSHSRRQLYPGLYQKDFPSYSLFLINTFHFLLHTYQKAPTKFSHAVVYS
jgi:hypothetical protein